MVSNSVDAYKVFIKQRFKQNIYFLNKPLDIYLIEHDNIIA